MKKLFLIIIALMLFIIPFTIAYDNNQRIIGEYKELGVFKSANANISIKNEFNKWVVYDIPMINIETGRFYYDYNCTKDGEYQVSIIFKNSSNELSVKSNKFYCGNENSLTFTSCPKTNTGITFMWVFLILLILLCIVGIIFNYPLITGISAFMLFMLCIALWNCGTLLSYFSLILGIIFMLTALAQKR